jgi:N utilization substance protein A
LPVKLTGDELKYIALLGDITGVTARDCVIDDETNTIIFIVPPGTAGLVVGFKGRNVKQLAKMLGRRVEIVEWADTLEDFVKNLFLPARVIGVRLNKLKDGKKVLLIKVSPEDKGIAIGKNGKNVNKARKILKRYYDIDSITVS